MTQSYEISDRSEDLLIVVDHREQQSGIIEYLEKDDLFVVRKAQLSCGDYLIGDLVVERKTGEDLFRSLEDGRLFSQIFLMKRSYRKRLLILENFKAIRALESLIIKLNAGLQIPVLFSKSTDHTAILLKKIAMQQFKYNASSPVIRHVRRTNDFRFQLRYILLGLPGVGIKRADALLKRFGTLEAIFKATEQELAETTDVGPILARSIRKLLQLQNPSEADSIPGN